MRPSAASSSEAAVRSTAVGFGGRTTAASASETNADFAYRDIA